MPLLDDNKDVPEKIGKLAELVMVLRNTGLSADKIVLKLKEKGCTDAEINEIMNHSLALRTTDNKTEGKNSIIIGAVWLGVGLLITIFSYSWAISQGGGSYLICWGPVLFGGYKFITGIIKTRS